MTQQEKNEALAERIIAKFCYKLTYMEQLELAETLKTLIVKDADDKLMRADNNRDKPKNEYQ